MRYVTGSLVWVLLAAGMLPADQKVAKTKKLIRTLGRDAGTVPATADGRRLNLDFETGTLDGWLATGDAFTQQPIKGDTVHARRRDMKSEHAGRFWIGTYEIAGDAPQGTLTSAPFPVTQPFASFLVAGGAYDSTRVELVRADTQAVILRASGDNTENLKPVVVDLRPHLGKEIFIRLVDEHSGGWGHINFDDFRFHATQPALPQPQAKVFEVVANAGLSPLEAAKAMNVPDGFKVTLFAGEPDVVQPIAMTIDDRGRLWVAEAYSYPLRLPENQARDRILIFEDTDGDGKFDRRKVFIDKLNLISGLEIGFGGVWVGAAPNLLFIPDKNRDDVPDGKPQVLLDGWGWQDTHETLNSLIWGPDGWLYGCHGVFTHSRVGKPGTPDGQRVPINAGIWRYHPLRHEFEVFGWGTSNPWGVDFDDRGQCFLTSCVIPHLFQIIQGARYHRQSGEHFNRHDYDDIKTIADHLHYTGNIADHAWWGHTPGVPQNVAEAGGGHAHAGCMIYLGNAWPKDYRGKLFMNNIHGARVNMDVLTPKGSGFVGSHGPDLVVANDRWSQLLYFRYGPDGQVYMIDWYDQNQCHRVDPKIHDRSNGRIFKISYTGEGKAAPSPGDLQKLKSQELVKMQLHENDYFVRQARRILQERGGDESIHAELAKLAFTHPDETRRLRGLWALHVTGGLTEAHIAEGLRNDSAYVRAWTVQLACEKGAPSSAVLATFAQMAKDDPSPVCRKYLGSALQRLPIDQRWKILAGLVSHADDAGDHNLPLVYWYAMEPMAAADPARALAIAHRAPIRVLLQFTVRRIASEGTAAAIAGLTNSLGQTADTEVQQTLLTGIRAALQGRRQVPMPEGWPKIYAGLQQSPDLQVRAEATALAVTFGLSEAFAAMRETLTHANASADARRAALDSLLAAKDKDLAPVLQKLLDDPALRGAALRGLAVYEHAQTVPAILSRYVRLNVAEKRDALATLAARPRSAAALLDAVADKKIPAADLTAEIVRQLKNLNDPAIARRVNDVWGIVRETAEDKAKLIAQYKRLVGRRTPPSDVSLGRAVFAKTCQQCHTLFGVGGAVGPDITGANRADLDYVLSNVLDPSAVMAKEYMPTVLAMADGRVVTGIIKSTTPQAYTVATQNETLTIPVDEVETSRLSEQSMMPDDLLKPLSEHEVRSLVAYLGSPRQVPMLATADNVKDFFNGRDLAGWLGKPQLWTVEDGQIVGRSPGLKDNEFLANQLTLGDFRLRFKVKLTPNAGNSGVQIRSQLLENGHVKGYQADIGAGWWGKLYEELGRGLLSSKSGEAYVKFDDWNDYEIVAVGSRVRTFINGQLCVDLDDPPGARQGIVALQLHAGGPMEVRFKDFVLELDPKPELAGPGGR